MFKVTEAEISSEGHLLKFGTDLGDIYFQHAILVISNNFVGWPNSPNEKHKFQNFEIYIGNNEDYSKNNKCAGGPFMRTDDSSNYQTWSYNGNTVWKFGEELWCNLEGRYMHIIADLSHRAELEYNLSLVTVGIMGTQYVRDSAVPEVIEVA